MKIPREAHLGLQCKVFSNLGHSCTVCLRDLSPTGLALSLLPISLPILVPLFNPSSFLHRNQHYLSLDWHACLLPSPDMAYLPCLARQSDWPPLETGIHLLLGLLAKCGTEHPTIISYYKLCWSHRKVLGPLILSHFYILNHLFCSHLAMLLILKSIFVSILCPVLGRLQIHLIERNWFLHAIHRS